MTRKPGHTSLRPLAKTIDGLIDHYKRTHEVKKFRKSMLDSIVKILFRHSDYLGQAHINELIIFIPEMVRKT